MRAWSTGLVLGLVLSLLATVTGNADAEKPATDGATLQLTADQTEFLRLEPILVGVRVASKNGLGLPPTPGEGKAGTLRFEVEPAVTARPKAKALPLEAEATGTGIQGRLYDLSEWFLFPDK